MKKIVYFLSLSGSILLSSQANAQIPVCGPAINQNANPQITSANPNTNLVVNVSTPVSFRFANSGDDEAPANTLELIVSIASATNMQFEPPYLDPTSTCGIWTVFDAATDYIILRNTGGAAADGSACDINFYVKALTGGQTQPYSVTVNRLSASCVGDLDASPANNTKSEVLTTVAAPLPVTLADFSAKTNGCNTILNWVSKTEKEFARYEIQNSQDGREYRTIGTVAPKGDNSTYAYTQVNAAEGANYYRLKMIDRDGSFEYSNVKKVNVACSNIQLAPTVTNGLTKVYGLSGTETVKVINNLGQIVTNQQVKGTEATIDLSAFAAGLYHVIVVRGAENVFAGKVVKQ
ncbi:T9SS type A sorting domain-containing protein [Taibaiella sp. KBW10]|uniref:T9SS type A sorting domain-containing protein n=1 Tax=Taibaiella sp. KBW10 TaxID=2153357 RepID=UPI0013152A14|nr:T9SS type A sorting domain-containing protein [Taibaiella sp. KBW10]